MLSYKDYRIYVRFVSWKDSLISVKANVACSNLTLLLSFFLQLSNSTTGRSGFAGEPGSHQSTRGAAC